MADTGEVAATGKEKKAGQRKMVEGRERGQRAERKEERCPAIVTGLFRAQEEASSTEPASVATG